MKATPAQIEKILALLAETPRRIAACTDGLSGPPLQPAPDAKAWSAADILAHLRACADLWTYSIYAILAEENPTLPDIDERKWAKVTGYASRPFADSFQVFCLQRETLLGVLRSLPPQGWERPARIFERSHTVF